MITLVMHKDDNDETLSVPSKKDVCHDCKGDGFVLRDGMRDYAYTCDDEEMHDPEFCEEYFRVGGIYDVVCPTCKGKNVVEVPDENEISYNAELKAKYEEYKVWKQDWDADQARWNAEY